MRDVKADHRGFHAAAQDGVGGLRVLHDVRFSAGCHIARHGQRTAHERDGTDELADARLTTADFGDRGHRAGGHDDQVLAVRVRRVDDEIRRGRRFRRAPRIGDRHVADAVVAVDAPRSCRRRIAEAFRCGRRTVETGIHRHFGMPKQVGDGERVAHAGLDGDVAIGAGDADQPDVIGLFACERIRDCQCVVDAGIQIENEFACHAGLLCLPYSTPHTYGDCQPASPRPVRRTGSCRWSRRSRGTLRRRRAPLRR